MSRVTLHSKPALIIAAFGSSRRGKAALAQFNRSVVNAYSGYDIFWAYTSAIIRKKTGNPGLKQTLAQVVGQGYSKAVVLPLQVFPGSEYRKIYDTVSGYPGLQSIVGETLMHRHCFFEQVVQALESDFLPPSAGLNVIALHGTSNTYDPVNSIYIDVATFVRKKYQNVFAAALEGIPDSQDLFHKVSQLKIARQHKHIRILPFMYTAGLHVEDDIMGETGSWKSQLSEMGYSVECLQSQFDGEKYYKSLAAYSDIHQLFLKRLSSCLEAFPQS